MPPRHRKALSLLLVWAWTLAACGAPCPPDVGACTEACDEGDYSSCNELGFALENGRGVAKDVERAVEIYEQSCDANNAEGCADLARMYATGEGGRPWDQAKALVLNEKACRLGSGSGCYRVGNMLEYGIVDHRVDLGGALAAYVRGCEVLKDEASCKAWADIRGQSK